MHLLIQADASTKMGTGHIMRCLALAQEWQTQGGYVTFISRYDNRGLGDRVEKEGFKLVKLEESCSEEVVRTLAAEVLVSHPGAWVVLDGYHFTPEYQQWIKETGHPLLVIDDMAHLDHYYADVILNQNIHAQKLSYDTEKHTRLLLGTDYALLRREFRAWQGWQRKGVESATKVLVTLGGADPDNVTLKVIQAFQEMNHSGLEAKILVGLANPHLNRLRESIKSSVHNLQLLTHVAKMPELMAWADIAVSAGGSTCWELVFMGVPNVIIVLADNQREVALELAAAKASLNLGWFEKVTVASLAQALRTLLQSYELRQHMRNTGRSLVDGRGAARVVEALKAEDKIGPGQILANQPNL